MLNAQQQDLVSYGLANLWGNPESEHRILLKLARISDPSGVTSRVKVMRSYLKLPDQTSVYHVFQVGQLFSNAVNLLIGAVDWSTPVWTTLSAAMLGRNLLTKMYTDKGIIIPNFEVYYMYTQEKDLIVAIKQDKNIPIDYTTSLFYLKLYTLFSGVVDTGGMVTQNIEDIVSIQNTLYFTQLVNGAKYLSYVNGFLVFSINPFSAVVGDTVEYVTDPTIDKVVIMKLKDLPGFTSSLDSKNKVMLRSAVPSITVSFDDIEIYLLNSKNTDVPLFDAASSYGGYYAPYQGVMYGHNNQDSVRMIGRTDYSIPTDDITNLAINMRSIVSPAVVNDDLMYVMLVLRQDSGSSSFNNTSSLLEYLELLDQTYGLYGPVTDQTKSTNILTHSVSGIDKFNASNIEQSIWAAYMTQPIKNINVQNTFDALGYSAVTKLFGDICYMENYRNITTAPVPMLLQNKFTAYEYSYYNSGTLLNSYTNNSGMQYNIQSPGVPVAAVELRYGNESVAPTVFYGMNNVNILPNVEYKVYRCNVPVSGVFDKNWSDITGNTFLYSVVNNILVDNDTASGTHFFMVRTNETILSYDIQAAVTNGILFTDMTESGFMYGAYTNYVMPVPMGELDVFLNGSSLVEGIDYIVEFPRIVIFNKKYLIQPSDSVLQNIKIRWIGFCDNTLKHIPCLDSGFIYNSALYSSINNFTPILDKALRFTVDGKLIDPRVSTTELPGIAVTLQGTGLRWLRFGSEGTPPPDYNPISGYEGTPYSLRILNTPTLSTLGIDSQAAKITRDADDKQLSDYFTSTVAKMSQPTGPISTLHNLYSPFISAIINGFISTNLPPVVGILPDMAILAITKPYEYLLPFDPARIADTNITPFIQIDPIAIDTAVQLTRDEYSFVVRVIELYTLNISPLNSFVIIV